MAVSPLLERSAQGENSNTAAGSPAPSSRSLSTARMTRLPPAESPNSATRLIGVPCATMPFNTASTCACTVSHCAAGGLV